MTTATSPPLPNPSTATSSVDPPSLIYLLPEDLLLKILTLLPSATDPRQLPRLSGVSRRLRHLLRSPLPSSLPLPLSPSPSVPYHTLHKLTVCCPGLLHAGVLLHNQSSDFGLSLDIGPDLSLPSPPLPSLPPPPHTNTAVATVTSTPTWSLFDDLYLDSSYDMSETQDYAAHISDSANLTPSETIPADTDPVDSTKEQLDCSSSNQPQNCTDTSSPKRRKKHGRRKRWMGPTSSHLATGNWSLSREQGSKLLASRFRGDSLYICDWPGCVHQEEKRKYMLFRGVFEDFKKSRVWKTIGDSKRGKIKLNCAYCTCNEMWDLHSAFCLRGFIGFHEDGEPVVRAFVCDNGHVSGAWTERPMYG
ncbi:phytochrome A-associated F-box protein-like protein [Carex littledalei]|uniref:Phytochrome A-associated F-box protein-like protein n=1 Tax=Carex littledalei TaxID=544730 RepID=A0A833RY90_9POAL|nr:phytochrome A-associated F-box protein-like protein [Carex littledalei]